MSAIIRHVAGRRRGSQPAAAELVAGMVAIAACEQTLVTH
jgi:hypothetical protein